MTPLERAEKIAEDTRFWESSSNTTAALEAIAEHIREAVEDEREACATLADASVEQGVMAVGAAIRSREGGKAVSNDTTADEAKKEGGVWLGGYDIKPLLDEARARGAAEEREACCEIVRKWYENMTLAPWQREGLIAAIRARGSAGPRQSLGSGGVPAGG